MEFSKSILVYTTNSTGTTRWGNAVFAASSYNAKLGVVNGVDGDSYAICIKDESGSPIDLRTLRINVDKLINFAKKHPDYKVLVSRFPSFEAEDIAPMFALAPKNMALPYRYKDILGKGHELWWYG